MKKPLVWTVTIVFVLGAFTALAALFILKNKGDRDDEPPASQPADAKLEPGHLKLSAEQIEHAGLKVEPIQKGTLAPDIRAFGVIQEDPAASFTLRAEAPGTLAPPPAAKDKPWPDVGQQITENETIGILQPRVMPSDQITLASQRVTLQGQLASAQADLSAAKIALDSARTIYERLQKLNAENKNVSDRAVEEAKAKVDTETAHVESAKKSVELTNAALDTVQMKLNPVPLVVAKAGEVVEVNAHPGEAIESGQPILRVATFDTVVAAVNIPIGETPASNSTEARILPIGTEERPLTGTRMGTAEQTDPKTHERIILFRVRIGDAKNLRPGHPVVAYVPAEGDALKGVTIPESAVVRYEGKGWVYLDDGNSIFERREVPLDHPSAKGDGWFVNSGFTGDEKLVTTGAQMLLSQEVFASIGAGGD
ncbi:MAG TPA: HlyD family efflux transporter periplasmic adaptor subunit [Phycisphaerae bacterium]|nr:HlyD family efflux transporter periplasmic adaptor subunit [Phycisphaerae bacterium]